MSFSLLCSPIAVIDVWIGSTSQIHFSNLH
jgi:hypothetical protein